MRNLSDYVEKIASTQTPEEAFDAYCSIMNYHGYDKIVYSLLNDHVSLNLPRQHGLATNYPEHWMKHYVESGYIDIDPVITQLKLSRKTFYWSDLMQHKEHDIKIIKMMHEANEAGLSGGIGVGFLDNTAEITGIGLCKSAPDQTTENDYVFLACVQYLSSYFHETYRDMLGPPISVNLTNRETDILQWASEGKTDDVISEILNISTNTIRYHWKSIFNKLGANGRVFATTKALRLNLINPISLSTTYQKR